MLSRSKSKNKDHFYLKSTKGRELIPFIISIFCFVIGLLISIRFLYVGSFGDEGDILSVGKLISEGDVLYNNIFSHHFPFPYYFLAAIFLLFPKTILTARMSLLIFELVIFILLIYSTKKFTLLSLTYLLWSIISRLYFGNMVLYHSFSGISIFGLLVLCTYAVFQDKPTQTIKIDKKFIFLFSILCFIALYSDVMSIFPVIVLFIGLFLFSNNYKKVFFIVLMVFILCTAFPILFLIQGSFSSFIREAILFNTNIYSQYYSLLQQNFFVSIGKNIFHLFYIFEPIKWINSAIPPSLGSVASIFKWFLSGFYFRFLIITFVLILLGKRNWKKAVWLYLIFVMLFFRSKVFFHMVGLVLSCIFISLLFIGNQVRDLLIIRQSPSRWKRVSSIIQFPVLLIILFYFGAISAFSISDSINNSDQIKYETSFRSNEASANRIESLACNLKGVKLAIYPGDATTVFFTGLKPLQGYLYMYPWVTEYAKEEVLEALNVKNRSYVIIKIDEEGSVWGRVSKDYLGDYLEYVKSYYYQTEDGYYISPQLLSDCKSVVYN